MATWGSVPRTAASTRCRRDAGPRQVAQTGSITTSKCRRETAGRPDRRADEIRGRPPKYAHGPTGRSRHRRHRSQASRSAATVIPEADPMFSTFAPGSGPHTSLSTSARNGPLKNWSRTCSLAPGYQASVPSVPSSSFRAARRRMRTSDKIASVAESADRGRRSASNQTDNRRRPGPGEASAPACG